MRIFEENIQKTKKYITKDKLKTSRCVKKKNPRNLIGANRILEEFWVQIIKEEKKKKKNGMVNTEITRKRSDKKSSKSP